MESVDRKGARMYQTARTTVISGFVGDVMMLVEECEKEGWKLRGHVLPHGPREGRDAFVLVTLVCE